MPHIIYGVVKIKNRLLRRKSSFKLPVWAVSILAACIVLLSFNIELKGNSALKTAYIGLLTAVPECVIYRMNEIKTEIKKYFSDNHTTGFIQKSGTYNDAESNDELTETPSDITENSKKYSNDNYTDDGEVIEKTYTDHQATNSFGNVHVRNVTDSQSIDIQDLLNKDFKIPADDISKPLVLIYHTHSTESYMYDFNGKFSTESPARNSNNSLNMIRVGEEITKILKNNGIGVIHDKTVYDTVYTGAYSISRTGAEKIIRDNPSIIITLDIHRDAIYYSDTQRVKPTAEINGEKAAQMMIIAGCQDGNVTDFPDWETNLTFALNLQKAANNKHKNLMKPVFFCMRKYNMDLTPYSLLIEIGTDVNTLQEAAYSARLLGDVLSDMIKESVK